MTADAAVAAVAARQHGRVAVRQLLAAGLTRSSIAVRVRAGRLHRVQQGVYAVGHLADLPLGGEAAALLAGGPGAVLSHWSAAALWRLMPRIDEVHLLVPRGRSVDRPGITVHRATTLEATDVRVRESLPLTSPTRTILDLAPRLSAAALERLIAEALTLGLADRAELARRGPRRITALLSDGPRFTRSDAERRLLSLTRRARLPTPRTNARVHGHEVDALWPAERLILEVDGWRSHGSRTAFERDRRRDQELHAAGFTTLRTTWRQLTQEPAALVALLASSLLPPPPAAAPRPRRRRASPAAGRATGG